MDTMPPNLGRPSGQADLNEIVVYNFRAARELRGWTQEETARALERLLGRRLPQASISAIERAYEAGDTGSSTPTKSSPAPWPSTSLGLVRSPPPRDHRTLHHTTNIVSELYGIVFGRETHLEPVYDRLRQLGIDEPPTSTAPSRTSPVGPAEPASPVTGSHANSSCWPSSTNTPTMSTGWPKKSAHSSTTSAKSASEVLSLSDSTTATTWATARPGTTHGHQDPQQTAAWPVTDPARSNRSDGDLVAGVLGQGAQVGGVAREHHRSTAGAGRAGAPLRPQKPPDGIGRGHLHRLQHMAVAVQGDLGRDVPVALAGDFRMHPGQQGDGGSRLADRAGIPELLDEHIVTKGVLVAELGLANLGALWSNFRSSAPASW